MSDGPQALLPQQYADVARQIRELAELSGQNRLSIPPTVPARTDLTCDDRSLPAIGR